MDDLLKDDCGRDVCTVLELDYLVIIEDAVVIQI